METQIKYRGAFQRKISLTIGKVKKTFSAQFAIPCEHESPTDAHNQQN